MKYQLLNGTKGRYFIKNHQYHYLDQYDIWGLDTSIWYDTIDYKFYKVKFITKDNFDYIQLTKNKETRKLEFLHR